MFEFVCSRLDPVTAFAFALPIHISQDKHDQQV